MKVIQTALDHGDITTMPPLVLGGATINTQYNDDPEKLPLVEMLTYGFEHGVRAIDTSPYYGPSEVLYGNALEHIRDEFPRDSYFLCTKVGRIQLDEFDYSRKHVRFSVHRSCERLKTDYLDLVYLHDVEFVTMAKSIEALKELKLLKSQGIIKNFGLSGYPVDYLVYLTKHCALNEPEIGPLDAVLTYCNMNLQNTRLLEHWPKWKDDAHLKLINNGSILSMSLLRSQETKSFHPCSQELRRLATQAAEYSARNGVLLADLATRYALAKWIDKGSTVLGVSSVEELQVALENYWFVKDNGGQLNRQDSQLIEYIQDKIFGSHMNEVWQSGIEHPELN
ncbi:probable D-arabinose 1-dehydrogenase [Zygosaccharomyces bailii]|nr:probable D-arabinose 1-dehydrogenase [Zygosaccharomyces bailii]